MSFVGTWGVLCFEKNSKSAWACRVGETAHFLADATDFHGDNTTWFTNLSEDDLSKLGLHLNYRFKSRKYFRIPYGAISYELGINSLPPQEQVVVLAEFIRVFINTAQQHTNVASFKSQLFLAELLPYLTEPEWPAPEMVDVLKQSTQIVTSCHDYPTELEGTEVMFRLPRHSHARYLLSLKVPTGRWEWIGKNQLPQSNHIAWLGKLDRPCIAAVKILRMQPGIEREFGFQKPRVYVTWPELSKLVGLARVEIEGVWIGEDTKAVASELIPPADTVMSLTSPPYTSSFAVGVYLENVHVAMRALKNLYGFPVDQFSFRATWLFAHERMLQFNIVQRLKQAGVITLNYSTGGIRVFVPNDGAEDVIARCFEHGLIAPFSYSEGHPHFFLQSEWHGDVSDYALAALTYAGKREAAIHMLDPRWTDKPEETIKLLSVGAR